METTVPPVLWEPPAELIETCAMTRFARWVHETRGVSFDGYEELWRWSVDELEEFWAAIWEFFDVLSDAPYERALADRTMPGAQWFSGARLSYSEHILRGKHDDDIALVHASELREPAEWTWGHLREQAARVRAGLRAMGVGPGDRVVAYMPNIPETLAAFLGATSLGAVWSSCSPDFGARSVIDRFAQIEPKVLLAVDGYRYGGKDFDKTDVVAQLEAEIPTLERTVVLPYLGEKGNWNTAFPFTYEQLTFERMAFDHPLWILYSSGTTGLPKAIVHGHGGILLEQLKKMHLHLDAREGDRVFWFTTTGWMMWNFLVGVLLTPSAIVLYDGNPGHPDPGTLWDLAERAGVTCFGTSAAYLETCMKAGVEPAAGRNLSRLRAVGSTGSPLGPEVFAWVYDRLGRDVWLFSTSGGTDVCSAFVGGTPLAPVYQGELQARSLGCKVEAFDEQGRPVVEEVGELVLTEPMPSMPLFLWDDPDGERYRESYFAMYPGVWRHGDWIRITDRGTAVIYGRSDSTINRGGVRMGTSEIYRAVLALEEIRDALVVDVPRPQEENRMSLFVVLAEGQALDDALTAAIRARIRSDCSPRHVPDEIVAVPEVPRTLSGKILEVPVKKILSGWDPGKAASRGSLANPAALDWFVKLAAERAGPPRDIR